MENLFSIKVYLKSLNYFFKQLQMGLGDTGMNPTIQYLPRFRILTNFLWKFTIERKILILFINKLPLISKAFKGGNFSFRWIIIGADDRSCLWPSSALFSNLDIILEHSKLYHFWVIPFIRNLMIIFIFSYFHHVIFRISKKWGYDPI